MVLYGVELSMHSFINEPIFVKLLSCENMFWILYRSIFSHYPNLYKLPLDGVEQSPNFYISHSIFDKLSVP